MRTTTLIVGALVGTGIILTTTFTAALATPDGTTNNDVNVSVSGGTLTATTSDLTLAPVVLDGASIQTTTGTPASAFTITDARGSGAVWSLSVTATDFISAAGTVDTTARTITAENLAIDPGTITAGTGSDAVPTGSPIAALSGTAQTLVATATPAAGNYSFTPTFTLTVPANAFRANFAGTIVAAVVNPYVSTLTYTIS